MKRKIMSSRQGQKQIYQHYEQTNVIVSATLRSPILLDATVL